MVDVKVLIFSILLMSVQGLKITPGKVRRFVGKTTTAAWEAGDQEVLEALVLLWKTAMAGSGCRSTTPKAVTGGASVQQPLVKQTGHQLQLVQGPVESAQIEPAVAQLQEGCLASLECEASNAQQSSIPEHPSLPGRYLYGIGWGTPPEVELPGIDQVSVFGIQYREITALVHACTCQPYQSEQRDLALTWVQQHQAVLDQMNPAFKCILPMGFDIIIDGTLAEDPDRMVREWLAARYERIMELLRQLAGKMEYGIQVMMAKAKLLALARDSNPQVIELERKIATMTKGTAFLFQSELHNTIREAVECRREEVKQSLKEQITPLTCALKEENTLGKQQNEQDEFIADFSVLAVSEAVDRLGTILEDFQNRWGVTVNFTGPWPPYNFVAELD